MSAKEPSPCWLRVEESRGSEACVDVMDGALVACELEVELADMVLEASDPANLLCVAIASFLFALVNELRKLLDEVSNLGRASTGELSPALGNGSGNAHWTGVSLEPAIMSLCFVFEFRAVLLCHD